VPACVTTGVFEVYDDKKLIGKTEVSMDRFTKLTEQITCKEDIKDEDGIVSGNLKFSVLRGANANMAPDKTIYRRTAVT
jgi:hypothetical protein